MAVNLENWISIIKIVTYVSDVWDLEGLAPLLDQLSWKPRNDWFPSRIKLWTAISQSLCYSDNVDNSEPIHISGTVSVGQADPTGIA